MTVLPAMVTGAFLLRTWNAVTAGTGPSGLNGGNAGNLHDNGLFPYMTHPAGLWGFNGGSGSSGDPPGAGGAAGVNDEGLVLGTPGQTGSTC